MVRRLGGRGEEEEEKVKGEFDGLLEWDAGCVVCFLTLRGSA